ncbi:hypothetical protein CIK05_09235 [Bdellovibrio sp. qaytius]|nr:hypothetical protein CIK05_09235 [Bdellovibrio sp. qaytius]
MWIASKLAMTKIFLFAFLFSVNLWAQTKEKILIISDIDDTIKVSHVISYKSFNPIVLFRTWDTTTPFAGMASLYQLILNENPGVNQVAYLSNAPSAETGVEYLQNSHQTFLKSNNFPEGKLVLRDVIFDSEHKNKSIRKLVAEIQPTLVIMVGDNGENDVNVYEQARKELNEQGIKNLIYIHQLYSSHDEDEAGKTLYPGQIGYATSVEIALDLNMKALLSADSANWVYEHTVPYILSIRYSFLQVLKAISFPTFKNCSDFKWVWPTDSHENLPEFKKYVTKTCK